MSRDENIKQLILRTLKENDVSMTPAVILKNIEGELPIIESCEVNSAINDLALEGIIIEVPEDGQTYFSVKDLV